MANANSITLSNNQESLFLSFLICFRNNYIGDMLLLYIAAGRDGNQALLNLRKVCSTTKSWIDELSPAQKRRFFPNLQVSIFLCRKYIADFLLSPPPYKVTSLKLENTDYLCSYRSKLSVEEKKLIKSFGAFWSPKLETLESKRLTEELMKVFALSTSLKSIHCDYAWEVFPKTMGLENLSIDDSETYGGVVPFFVNIAAQDNLKKLEIRSGTEDLEGLTTLVKAKRFNKQFKLRARLCFERNRNANLFEMQIRRELNLDVLKDFVYAVANSSSSISLTGLNDFALSKIVEVTEHEKTLHNFYTTVRWIGFWYFKNLAFIVDLLKGNKFPNLERFDENRLYAPPEQVEEEVPELFQLPGKIQFLTICSRALLKQILFPQSLKYLGFDVRNLTILELQESICTISDSCPFLEEVLVTWTCALPITIDDVSSRLKNKEIFPHLQYLGLSAAFTFQETSQSTRLLLFDILKLNAHKVKDLQLFDHSGRRNGYYPMVLGSEVFNLLLKSPLAESLLCYRFDVTFENDHEANLEVLTALAERNSVLHQQRYGRKKISSCPDYLYKEY